VECHSRASAPFNPDEMRGTHATVDWGGLHPHSWPQCIHESCQPFISWPAPRACQYLAAACFLVKWTDHMLVLQVLLFM
jgi:hypothetical protein